MKTTRTLRIEGEIFTIKDVPDEISDEDLLNFYMILFYGGQDLYGEKTAS